MGASGRLAGEAGWAVMFREFIVAVVSIDEVRI